MSLGARVLKDAEDGDSADTFRVYADPAGHPFCICWVKELENDPIPAETLGWAGEIVDQWAASPERRSGKKAGDD